jgi:hypothetical protein
MIIDRLAMFSGKLPLCTQKYIAACSQIVARRLAAQRCCGLDCFQQRALSVRFALTSRLMVEQHHTNEFQEK